MPQVTIRIPTPLRQLTRGQDQVRIPAATVGEALEGLDQAFPGLRSKLCEESGELRRFVNLFLGEEDVRHLAGLRTPVKEGDVLAIVPAIAGGAEQGASRCAS